MASIVVAGDTSGTITLAAPAVAGTNTLTLPTNTGTIITTASTFAGTGPAFHAYQSTQQTGISTGVFTLVNLQTEEFDTASRFNNTNATVGGIPAYAFLPNVAGYYQVNCTVWMTASGTVLSSFVNLWRNGGWFKDGSFSLYNSATSEAGSTLSTLVYLNGTTDYIQMYIWGNVSSGTYNLYGAFQQQRIHFSASMVRAA